MLSLATLPACEQKAGNSAVNKGTGDQEFTDGNPDSNVTANENNVNVKNLERFFNERIVREISDKVEDRVRKAILTAIDIIVAPRIELAIRSIKAPFVSTSVAVNSERGEHIGITAPF